jgi:hypothetical protein
VQIEAVFQIEDVMGDSDGVGHVPRIVDRIQRAARAVGNVVAIAEQLHRRAYHVVALLDEVGSCHGAVDPTRHGD